jgi:hypothetical protein
VLEKLDKSQSIAAAVENKIIYRMMHKWKEKKTVGSF